MFEIHYTNDNVDIDGHNWLVTHLEPHCIQTHTKRSRLSFHYQLCLGWTKSSIYTVRCENIPAFACCWCLTLSFSLLFCSSLPCQQSLWESLWLVSILLLLFSTWPPLRLGPVSRPAVFTGRKLSPAALRWFLCQWRLVKADFIQLQSKQLHR